MKTGLTKRQKTTCIYFDEASSTVEVQTHNTALKNRLTKYAAEHPDLCRQTDDDEQGGLTFEIDRRRFAVRLTAPYSDERRQAASELAKKNGLKGRVYNTARPARTAAAATPGCSRAMRSISNRSRRADSGTSPCLWAAKETEAVAQPLLIET